MMCEAKVTVCSEISTKQAAQSDDHVEFLNINLLAPNYFFKF